MAVGADGLVDGVSAEVVVAGLPVEGDVAALMAATRNQYGVPLVRPVTV